MKQIGCLTLVPNRVLRAKAYYKNIYVYTEDFARYLNDIYNMGGFYNFGQRAEKFMSTIGNESLEFMRLQGIGFKFIVYRLEGNWLWGNTDLFDIIGVRLCRGKFIETANFLKAYAYPDSQKLALLKTYITDFMLDSKNIFDPTEFERITGKYVPLSVTGLSPDYGIADEILYLGDRFYGNIRIVLTGVRDVDFNLANAKAGITGGVPTGYVWHHLDDFDPVTREGTLQLIKREYHLQTIYGKGTVKHIGGVALWEKFFGCTYK